MLPPNGSLRLIRDDTFAFTFNLFTKASPVALSNRFSSGVYTVSGSLDEPEVNFDRIFDDTGAAAVEPGAAGEPDATEQALGFERPQAPAADPNQSLP